MGESRQEGKRYWKSKMKKTMEKQKQREQILGKHNTFIILFSPQKIPYIRHYNG